MNNKLVETLVNETDQLSIEQTLSFLTTKFNNQVAFSTSFGQEDQVLTHQIFKNSLPVRIFTLDTGRLFQETYEVYERTIKKYQIEIEAFFPDFGQVENLLKKGPNSFYDSVENRKECCSIRKIIPLHRALKNTKIWVTGLRGSQSDNRHHMHRFEFDEKFNVIKYNPLINWSLDMVVNYLELNNVPQNKLHKQGFASIGCAPCTRAIKPEEDLRAGRWWWENSKKECGLHALNNQKKK